MTLNITYEAFRPLLDWGEAAQAIIDGHQHARAQIGDTFLGPSKATLLTRSAYIADIGYGVKAVSVFDDNPRENLPTIQGGMFFFEPLHGRLVSVIATSLITNVKTAIDSALGAKFLARPRSEKLLIVGAGNMARPVIEAYRALFPHLKEIKIWSRRPQQARDCAQKYASLVQATEDLPGSCAAADIISTITMARTPVISGNWIREGTHVDLIGAYKRDMREADNVLMKKGKIFIDSRESTCDHIGELYQPLCEAVISREDICGDLYELVAGKAGRSNSQEITIYKNGGGAHLDTMIAGYITRTYQAYKGSSS